MASFYVLVIVLHYYKAVVSTRRVFARILSNRMRDAVDQLLRQQQTGFRPGR